MPDEEYQKPITEIQSAEVVHMWHRTLMNSWNAGLHIARVYASCIKPPFCCACSIAHFVRFKSHGTSELSRLQDCYPDIRHLSARQ